MLQADCCLQLEADSSTDCSADCTADCTADRSLIAPLGAVLSQSPTVCFGEDGRRCEVRIEMARERPGPRPAEIRRDRARSGEISPRPAEKRAREEQQEISRDQPRSGEKRAREEQAQQAQRRQAQRQELRQGSRGEASGAIEAAQAAAAAQREAAEKVEAARAEAARAAAEWAAVEWAAAEWAEMVGALPSPPRGSSETRRGSSAALAEGHAASTAFSPSPWEIMGVQGRLGRSCSSAAFSPSQGDAEPAQVQADLS